MPYNDYALRSVLIAALLPAISVGLTNSAEPALVEQSLQAIRDCMARSPAPWPEAVTYIRDYPRFAGVSYKVLFFKQLYPSG